MNMETMNVNQTGLAFGFTGALLYTVCCIAWFYNMSGTEEGGKA